MKRAAVLGSPISHSLSPVLHTAGYTALGIAAQWHYGRYECDEHGLAAFLDQCDESWAGLSLTMPLKKVALTLADEVEDTAAAVGGANTIIFDKGRRHAYNTDVTGITEALREAGIHRLDTVTILGAGATAASALAAVRRSALPNPARSPCWPVTFRTRDLAAAAERMGAQVKFALLTEIDQHVHADLVVSTLPAGAADQWAEPVAAAKTPVFDVVYAPWPTVLGSAAAAAGAVVVGGFPMLLHQAVAQLTLMTGYEAPVEAMRAAGEAELARRAARNNLDT